MERFLLRLIPSRRVEICRTFPRNRVRWFLQRRSYPDMSVNILAEGPFIELSPEGRPIRQVFLGITNKKFIVLRQYANDNSPVIIPDNDLDLDNLEVDHLLLLKALRFFVIDNRAKKFNVCTSSGQVLRFEMCQLGLDTDALWTQWRNILKRSSYDTDESTGFKIWHTPFQADINNKGSRRGKSAGTMRIKQPDQNYSVLFFYQHPSSFYGVRTVGVQANSAPLPAIRRTIVRSGIPTLEASKEVLRRLEERKAAARMQNYHRDNALRTAARIVIDNRSVIQRIEDRKAAIRNMSNQAQIRPPSPAPRSRTKTKDGKDYGFDLRSQAVQDRSVRVNPNEVSNTLNGMKSPVKDEDGLMELNPLPARLARKRSLMYHSGGLMSSWRRVSGRTGSHKLKRSTSICRITAGGTWDISGHAIRRERIYTGKVLGPLNTKIDLEPENDQRPYRTGSELWTVARCRLLKSSLKHVSSTMLERCVRDIFCQDMVLSGKMLTFDATKFRPADIAEYITSENKRILLSVSPSDMMQYLATNGQQEPISIKSMFTFSDDVSKMVAVEILKFRTIRKRVAGLQFFTQVCMCLFSRKDYQGMHSVMRGLTSLPVYRLETTWTAFDALQSISFSQFLCIAGLFSPRGHFRAYTNRLDLCLEQQVHFLPWLNHFMQHALSYGSGEIIEDSVYQYTRADRGIGMPVSDESTCGCLCGRKKAKKNKAKTTKKPKPEMKQKKLSKAEKQDKKRSPKKKGRKRGSKDRSNETSRAPTPFEELMAIEQGGANDDNDRYRDKGNGATDKGLAELTVEVEGDGAKYVCKRDTKKKMTDITANSVKNSINEEQQSERTTMEDVNVQTGPVDFDMGGISVCVEDQRSPDDEQDKGADIKDEGFKRSVDEGQGNDGVMKVGKDSRKKTKQDRKDKGKKQRGKKNKTKKVKVEEDKDEKDNGEFDKEKDINERDYGEFHNFMKYIDPAMDNEVAKQVDDIDDGEIDEDQFDKGKANNKPERTPNDDDESKKRGGFFKSLKRKFKSSKEKDTDHINMITGDIRSVEDLVKSVKVYDVDENEDKQAVPKEDKANRYVFAGDEDEEQVEEVKTFQPKFASSLGRKRSLLEQELDEHHRTAEEEEQAFEKLKRSSLKRRDCTRLSVFTAVTEMTGDQSNNCGLFRHDKHTKTFESFEAELPRHFADIYHESGNRECVYNADPNLQLRKFQSIADGIDVEPNGVVGESMHRVFEVNQLLSEYDIIKLSLSLE